MLKLNRTATQSRERPTSGGNFFDAADNPDTVTVSNGPYGDNYPVAGMTVAQIRARLRDRLDIDPQSQAIVDGHDVGDEGVAVRMHRADDSAVFAIVPQPFANLADDARQTDLGDVDVRPDAAEELGLRHRARAVLDEDAMRIGLVRELRARGIDVTTT